MCMVLKPLKPILVVLEMVLVVLEEVLQLLLLQLLLLQLRVLLKLPSPLGGGDFMDPKTRTLKPGP